MNTKIRPPITECDIMLAAMHRSTRQEDWQGVATCMIAQHTTGTLNQLVRDTFLKKNPYADLDNEVRTALGLRLKLHLPPQANAESKPVNLAQRRKERSARDRNRTFATRGDAVRSKTA